MSNINLKSLNIKSLNLFNLPFQGVMITIFHKIPRRCHWAELMYGFQPFLVQKIEKTILVKIIIFQ